MASREFGFICGHFSVGMSNNGFVLPGSDNLFFRKSLIPSAGEGEVSGRYLLRVHHLGKVVCSVKVEVGWGTHPTQVEPFLGIKAANSAALSHTLRQLSGKHVELQFTPIPNASG
jgi:hypothetical protein